MTNLLTPFPTKTWIIEGVGWMLSPTGQKRAYTVTMTLQAQSEEEVLQFMSDNLDASMHKENCSYYHASHLPCEYRVSELKPAFEEQHTPTFSGEIRSTADFWT